MFGLFSKKVPAESPFSLLTRILDSEAHMNLLLSMPPASLTSEQRTALLQLSRHFYLTAAETETDPGADSPVQEADGHEHERGGDAEDRQMKEGSEEAEEGDHEAESSVPEETDPSPGGTRTENTAARSARLHSLPLRPRTRPRAGASQAPSNGLGKRSRELVSLSGSEDESESDDEEAPQASIQRSRSHRDGPSSKRPRVAPPTPTQANSPWSRFLKLKPADLQLSQAVQEHLDEYGDDAAAFLLDTDECRGELSTGMSSAERGNAFSSRYAYTLSLRDRREKDTVRWGFVMIMYFDLVKLVRPSGTGRVGRNMLRDLQEYLGAVLEYEGIDTNVALADVNEWSIHGSKLSALCEAFGPGCLFFLDGHLTPDFLKNKYTATGKAHEEAFAHLHGIGLASKVAESRVNQLAANIRALLIQPFQQLRSDLQSHSPRRRGSSSSHLTQTTNSSGFTAQGSDGGSSSVSSVMTDGEHINAWARECSAAAVESESPS
ncbi:uncharacterized protein A1O5_09734 [Cladophialophora psammophila CBS 110553]|uniref:Uncharacterized protein n=1 Tax=Cladophialophora psammophila CBS 110553 TaxID=1182543 RepID=W9WGP0_9EURO|nr:uncharacterized protein A1O5_09734 [Cladophialophora psammophila CBS 110553]EXJ67088.1 hypothetical protein A1O5_09734 [Cladophialophora psammophila CBS 110553]